jgi:hypothetical protein
VILNAVVVETGHVLGGHELVASNREIASHAAIAHAALSAMLRNFLVAMTSDVMAMEFEKFKQQLAYRSN